MRITLHHDAKGRTKKNPLTPNEIEILFLIKLLRIMKKRFYGALVLGSLLLGGGVVTSCSDYDDDINNLNQRVDAVEKTLTDLKTAIEGGVTINSIETTDNGIVIKTSKGDFTITNGSGQAGCTVEIGPNGTWVINGTDTGKPSKGADGAYYEPNAETNTWWKVEGDQKTDTGISYLASGTITAVYDKVNGELLLSGVEGYQGTLVLSLTTGLRSLVFQPDFYYEGIEAMAVGTYNYKEKTVAKVNADDDFSKDAPTVLTGVAMSPGLVANYHMNPSNADINKIEQLSFISDDKNYTRAEGGVVKATVTGKEAKDGILTVHAQLTDGTIKDIESDGKVTVLALQANYKNAEEKVDTVITSDYAAVKAVNYENLELAHVDATPDKHLYTTAAEAIANEADYEIVWNHEGMDIAELIQTHYDDASKGEKDIAWDVNAKSGTVDKYGFEYSYELVGYHKGNNKTSESAHAAMQGSILRPQMPKDGKQQGFGAEQNKAEKDREPLVRVILKDKISNKIAAVGYIKFKIVEKETPVQSEVIFVNNPPFAFTNGYTVDCSENATTLKIEWHDFEEDILAQLVKQGISKEDFHDNFKLEGVDTDATQYDGTEATSQPTTKKGIVAQTTTDTGAEETQIITWTLKNNEAYQLFKNNKSIAVNIRYSKAVGTNLYQYIYITLTWTPTPLNVKPAGTLANSDKISNYWYTYNSATPGSGYDEIHANVEPVKQSTDANDNFKSDILNTFVGNDVTVSDVNSVYTAFQNEKLNKEFTFVDPQDSKMTPVKGNSGTMYDITVSADGKTLFANVVGNSVKQPIVVINQTAKEVFLEYQGKDDNANYAFARDILNAADHAQFTNDSEGKKTFTAQIQINAENCDYVPFDLSNNTFFAKFLRPITISDPHETNFVDATTGGAKADLKLTFIDWRDHNFDNTAVTQGENYYQYYGVESIEQNGDILTDLNGTSGVFDRKLKDVTKNVEFTFAAPTATDIQNSRNFGTLTYLNNGTTVGNFQIKVPFDVTYDWGTIQVWVVCKISQTEAN